ncbi:MAG: hypothetical protein R6X07_15000 [Desulfatiglandales bacterium]
MDGFLPFILDAARSSFLSMTQFPPVRPSNRAPETALRLALGSILKGFAVFLANLLHLVASPMAVAIDRTDDRVASLDPVFKVPLAVVHVPIVIFKLTAARLDQALVELFHLGEATDNEYPFGTKLQSWA